MKKILVFLIWILLLWWVSLAENQVNEAVSRMNGKWLTKFENATDFMASKSLRRDEATKFFVQYAKEVLWLIPNTGNMNCNFNDLWEARPDLKTTIIEACQLWLFQWNKGKFMPKQALTNAQAITVLMRMVNGKQDESQWHFAQKYFEKAKELQIMNWLTLDNTANFDTLTTRGDVGVLIFNASKKSNKKDTTNINNIEYYTVIRVIDWDTIEINSGWKIEKIRLIWVDTPETVDTSKTIQCFGKEASKKATELLLNKKVKLIIDETQGNKDKYDRLLRYVYTEDGTLVNKILIEQWYANEYTYKTAYKFQKEFKTGAEYASKNKIWLWAENACGETWKNITTTNKNTNTINTNTSNTHIFYTSSYYSSKTYYCDTDLSRKGLSPKYLKSYSSENELLKVYPWKKLNESCK